MLQTLSGEERSAFVRILVGFVVLLSADVWGAPALVALREPTLVAPAQIARVVVIVAAVCVVVGVFGRVAALALTVSLVLLLGAVQRLGTPVHVHHLVWLSAVLVFTSPCSAWTLSRRPLSSSSSPSLSTPALNSTSASETVWCAALVLAAVYFFPGLHKLIDSGTPFFDGDSLARLVRLKALEAHRTVPFDLDDHPVALCAAGLTIAVLEMAVFPLVWRRKRAAGFVIALLHVSFGVVLHIPFGVLAVFALVPLLLRREDGWSSTMGRVGCGLLIIPIGVAGALGRMNAWPFACYPHFAVPVPHEVEVVHVVVDGVIVDDDLVIPRAMRTTLTADARTLRSAADATRFLRHRAHDERVWPVLKSAQTVSVVRARFSLDDEQERGQETLLTVGPQSLR